MCRDRLRQVFDAQFHLIFMQNYLLWLHICSCIFLTIAHLMEELKENILGIYYSVIFSANYFSNCIKHSTSLNISFKILGRHCIIIL